MSALISAAVLPLVALPSPSIAQADPNGYSRPDLAARFEELCARFRARWEYDRVTADEDYEDPELDSWEFLSNECAALGKQILSVPAASLADIVLQTRAVALENNELWQCPSTVKDMHLGQRFTRQMIESLCQFTGASIFGDSTIAFAAVESPTNPDHALLELGNAFEAAIIEDNARWEIVHKNNDGFDWKRNRKIMRLEDNPIDRGIARLLGISVPCDFISPGWIPKLEELGPSCHADLKKRIHQISREQVTLSLWRQRPDRIEAEERAQAAGDTAHNLAERIVAMPASTLEGLRVKAKVFKWCRRSEPDEAPAGMDEVAIFSMVEDLLNASAAGGAA